MNTAAIIQMSDQYLLGNYARVPVAFVRGEGSYLWDAEGKRYLDFMSGIAVNALGHAHPRLLKTLHEQAGQLIHASNIFYHEPQAKLAKKLVELSFADRVFFCNSGAEANEAAFKLARAYGKAKHGEYCYEILSLDRSFHGRTLAAVAATGQEKIQKGFEPLPVGFAQVPPNDFEALKAKVTPKTCAILLELVQGEGGVYPLDTDYIEAVSKLCEEKDLLLILDEIQTGLGRTGKLFAYQHFNIKPQIMTLAKPLGAGLPIGACLCTQKVADAFWVGGHGSTYGGNPLVTAVAGEFLDIVSEAGFLEQVASLAGIFQQGLKNLAKACSLIDHVRGLGLMAGVVLKVEAKPVMKTLLEHGLVVNAVQEHALRLLPPLNLSESELEAGLSILKEVLKG